MIILVTGGAGFIGSHTVKALLDRGDTVICVDDFNDYYDVKLKEYRIKPWLDKANFKLERGSIGDSVWLESIFKKYRFEVICHLAARAGVRASIENPQLYDQVNIGGTMNLLECCRKHHVNRVVFASSSSVYGNNKNTPFSETDPVDQPISPYAATKRAGELLMYTYHHLYNLKATCLRFFTVYGPAGRPDMAPYIFTAKIYSGQPIQRFGDGLSQRDYTYVDDVVEGIIAAIDNPFDYEIINLGNHTAVALNDFIAVIEKNLKKKAVIENLPAQPGDVLLTYADTGKATRLLRYRPKIGIEEGMEKFISWYRQFNS